VLAARRKLHIDFTPVVFSQHATHQSSSGQPVDQLDRAVMLNLQTLSQIGNTSGSAAGHTFYGKQELMLLRFEPGGTGGVFAESEKAANLIAKLGDCLVVGEFEVGGSTF